MAGQVINLGNIEGNAISVSFQECKVIKVEKSNYSTFSSTTTTRYADNYGANDITAWHNRNTTVTTNTNSTPHFYTKVYLDSGDTLRYEYDMNIVEGWHIRYISGTYRGKTTRLGSFIPESGQVLERLNDVSSWINGYLPFRQTSLKEVPKESFFLEFLACFCIFYDLHTVIPAFFNIKVPLFIQIIPPVCYLAITIILKIKDLHDVKILNEYSRIKWMQESSALDIYNQQVQDAYSGLLSSGQTLAQSFTKNGLEGLNEQLRLLTSDSHTIMLPKTT